MKSQFPLFNSHLDLAHFWWQKLVCSEDFVIDMTCGNGHDTAFLADLKPAKLVAIDIQEAALEKARLRVPTLAEFLLKDHADFPHELEDESVKLAVYNLGWLPGSDKTCTTQVSTTCKSIFDLLPKIVKGGAISITCYPGHLEGKIEEAELLEKLQQLSPFEWNVCHHRWQNRKDSPSLLLLQRRVS